VQNDAVLDLDHQDYDDRCDGALSNLFTCEIPSWADYYLPPRCMSTRTIIWTIICPAERALCQDIALPEHQLTLRHKLVDNEIDMGHLL